MYFDNLNVRDTRGRIIEEDHYYAYGLKIAGISSNKLPDPNEGNIDTKNLYNDKELLDDADLDWYDYGFRSYDAQIGRFPQLDPLTDKFPHYTPYQYAGDEPIANVDMDGLEPAGAVSLTNSLAKNGISSSMHLVEQGAYAGRWSVNWFAAGASHSATFAVKASAGIGAKLAGLGANLAVHVTASLLRMKQNFVNNWSSWGSGAADLLSHEVQVGKNNWNDGTFGKTLSGILLPSSDNPFGFISGVQGLAATEMEVALNEFSQEDRFVTEATAEKEVAREAIEELNKVERYDGPKPKYAIGEHYENEFNKGNGKSKTSLPSDAEEVYKSAVPNNTTNPRVWFGVNKDGIVYRYSADNNGIAHFSGRSDFGDKIRNYTPYAKSRLKQISPNVKF